MRLAAGARGLALAAMCLLGACGGEGGGESAPPPAEGRVASVPDGETLILDTGLEVRLAGLRAPRPAEGRAPAEPYFHAARRALSEAALSRIPALAPPPGAEGRDRHGRLVAHARVREVAGETWLQARLVAAGLARVDPEAALMADADGAGDDALLELLALEAEARDADRGLWAEPYFVARTPESVGPATGSFQIVEGRVVDAAEVRGTIYLNFGADWRSDFTAMVAREHVERFDADALLASPGARVRVRGFVERRNGPLIALTAPRQLEWLEEGGAQE